MVMYTNKVLSYISELCSLTEWLFTKNKIKRARREKQIHKFHEWKQLKHMEEHQFLSFLFTLKWPRDVAAKRMRKRLFFIYASMEISSQFTCGWIILISSVVKGNASPLHPLGTSVYVGRYQRSSITRRGSVSVIKTQISSSENSRRLVWEWIVNDSSVRVMGKAPLSMTSLFPI